MPRQGIAPRAQNAPMKAPPRLQSLIEEGLIDTVVRQLMSGKEAMVFVVRCGDETRCASIWDYENNKSNQKAGWSLPRR